MLDLIAGFFVAVINTGLLYMYAYYTVTEWPNALMWRNIIRVPGVGLLGYGVFLIWTKLVFA